MEIGALIKQKRIQKDMKLEELAKRVGVSAATVLGAGCRRFKSCHPDMRKKSEKPRNSAVFQTFSIEKTGV